MTLKEHKEKLKNLNEEEIKQYIDNLTDDDKNFIKQLVITQHKVNYVFKDDDFIDYTDDEEELNQRIENIKNTINSYKQEDLYYTKESLLNPNILKVLAYCIKNTENDLDPIRLNELISRYNKINDFIYYDKNYDDIIGFYGDIVNKDDNGFYIVNDAIAHKIVVDNDLNISDKDLTDIKEAINITWENKKEILNPYEINNLSEEQNGINFKEFIFCEEYIKRGKIKSTCDYLGISRNTAYTWLKKDNIQAYLKGRQEEIKKETDDTFLQTYRESFNQLNKMINSTGIETTDKIKAIDIFLKH